MIAADTNILVYSQREDSQFFVPAESSSTSYQFGEILGYSMALYT